MKKSLNLEKKFSLEVRLKAPFNFDATVFKPSYFPTPNHIWKIVFGKKRQKDSLAGKRN